MRLAAQWQWSGQGIQQAGECRVVVGILGEGGITVAQYLPHPVLTTIAHCLFVIGLITRVVVLDHDDQDNPSPIPETFRTPPCCLTPMMMVMSLRICGHFGRGVRGLSTTPRLRTFCWAVLMGILLPPSPPPPWPATHRLPLRPMPIPQPRAIPRIAITPAQSPSDTSRSSSGSNVATLVPVQPCASADRASTCRRPPTAEPEVDVARQRIRELVLDHFLQTHAPMECNMGALVSISTLRVELRDILWLIDHLLDETPCDQSLRISDALWREMRSSLEGLLVGI
ncbi:hypothetical protein J6590_083122 [Homalodisca vitripennis]|nr:hypothetical protein J6590_083122 [Homalodisca vitripennis]